jgi:N-acetylmuramoyl-L-alanine amidase
VIAELAASALICLDPGHDTVPAVARGTEPIGPGSATRKLVDGGGAAGEAAIVLAIAQRTRALLLRDGYRVAMTRGARPTTLTNAGRARFCNVRHAALMLRIHADGSPSTSLHGVQMLYPAFHRGWTDDIYGASLRAARSVQTAVVHATRARDLGLTPRADLTGFNWADVPAILVETGFVTNPAERRLLHSGTYQQRVARGLAAGVAAFVRP